MSAINVNLKPCTCGCPVFPTVHVKDCPGISVPIPCLIPRSVTFEVRLGECDCLSSLKSIGTHTDDCRSRPIRVSGSISGKTWAESEPSDVEGPSGAPVDLITVCRDRWALVKALVLGQWPTVSAIGVLSEAIPGLVEQRDAVYAALADMARAEEAAFDAQERAVKAMGEATYMPHNFHRAEPHARASADLLARYVERLVEQAGAL